MSERRQYHGGFPDGEPDDRGVSEVISFALIFSLIVATVALVYVSGIGGLEDTRASERITNAERAFDVLADNIADIHREGAPSRATEIKLADARLQFGDSTRITVQVENLNETLTEGGNTSTVTIDPIVYSSDSGPKLVYSNGGVFRQDRGGTVVNRRPSFLFPDDGGERTAVVPAIQTRNVGPDSTGSQRTILVRTLLATREVAIAEDNPAELTNNANGDDTDENSFDLDPDNDGNKEYNVTIHIETDEERRDVWLDYLNDEIPDSQDIRGDHDDGTACEPVADRTVECSIAVENIYSTVTRVDVQYD